MTITEVQDLYRKIVLPENFHVLQHVICDEIYTELNIFNVDEGNEDAIRKSLRKKLQPHFEDKDSYPLMEGYFMSLIKGLDLLDLLLPTTGWYRIELRSFEYMRYWADHNSYPEVIWGQFWLPKDVRIITERIAAELGQRFDAVPESRVIKSPFRKEFQVTGSYREYHGEVEFFITRVDEWTLV